LRQCFDPEILVNMVDLGLVYDCQLTKRLESTGSFSSANRASGRGGPRSCKIVHERMGGFPVVATVDEGSETVYVANNDDGTVSVFPSSR
jgi:hypothetical protein